MSSDLQRLLQTTTPKFIRQVEVNILRNRKLLALMQRNGRIVMNDSGTELNWKVEYKRSPMLAYTEGQTLTFDKKDRHKTATLDWRAYAATDAMSEMEFHQNKGQEAIVKNYKQIMSNLQRDMEEEFGSELYKDGNAAGNTGIHGIESFMGAGSALNNGFYDPNDTYAGLSTVKATYGGLWSGTWPDGFGNDGAYDFWSPIIVNYTDATAGVYSAATKTWPNTCVEAIRFGLTKCRKSRSEDGKLDLILLEEKLYDQFKNSYEGKQQIHVYRGEQLGLLSLGFQDTMMIDGCDVSSEFGMTSGVGYMFNTMQMELRSLADRLFLATGPVFDEESLSWRWVSRFYGNARYNPKFFGKFKA